MGVKVKLFYDGDKFWNYAKNKYVDVQLEKCPKCGSDPILIDEYGDTYYTIGTGYVACQNPNCLCRTRIFFTDTNHHSAFGIEKAQEIWNNRKYDWFEI